MEGILWMGIFLGFILGMVIGFWLGFRAGHFCQKEGCTYYGVDK